MTSNRNGNISAQYLPSIGSLEMPAVIKILGYRKTLDY